VNVNTGGSDESRATTLPESVHYANQVTEVVISPTIAPLSQPKRNRKNPRVEIKTKDE